MNKFNIIFITLYFICGILGNENFVSINNIHSIDKRYSLGKINNISINDKNGFQKSSKIFDLANIASVFRSDIQSPRIYQNISVSDIFDIDETNVSKECIELIQSKYSCIILQDKDFSSFCEKINENNCNFSDNQIKFDIRDKCNVELGEVEDFISTVNNIVSTKKFFCLKGNNTEYCPITKSLQKGYLELIKETEKNEKLIAKKKRSPLISNVNSFISSRAVDVQVIGRKIIEDIKKNCNDTICRAKTIEYIKSINTKNDYSYFNLIYQYQVNAESLKERLIEVLNEKECSDAYLKYKIQGFILLSWISLVIVLLLT